MSEKFIVDRIEDGIATLEAESGEHINISVSFIGETITAGSVLTLENGEYSVDEEATSIRKSKILKKHRSVFGKK